MTIKKFTAKTMKEALQRVQDELGPDATVLRTVQLPPRGLLGQISSRGCIEVTASGDSKLAAAQPSRQRQNSLTAPAEDSTAHRPAASPAAVAGESRLSRRSTRNASASTTHADLRTHLVGLQQLVHQLQEQTSPRQSDAAPDALISACADLIEADMPAEVASELTERVRCDADGQITDRRLATDHVRRLLESQLDVSGAIQVARGQRRLVALVGPTGVGKTTTIAKLAADFRLRQKHKVGLITVDTYRIAAVDQLQTYADIIDLPMEVVSTPREMRAAIGRLQDQELILLDTAGRSPRDDIRLQELKSMLAEAQADEVHLVLSSTAGRSQFVRGAAQFAQVGTTHVILTKLDEVSALGHVFSPLRHAQLPLSYVTNGQNVPDDIEPASAKELANLMLAPGNL